MGFLDKAKQVAEQAKQLADQAKELAGDRLQEARAPSEASSPPDGAHDERLGTPYVPGMLGRPGWRERGLVDPAALLPIEDRDRAGIPHSTKSEVTEEPYGMGRRWSSGERSAALFYQLYPEHQSWQPPGGTAPVPDLGAASATLPDGRSLLFLSSGDTPVVVELQGLPQDEQSNLARAVAAQLG
ncbi:MAG TPA: hypothetical protein VD926_00305 [Acidimicrobiales bacterium]|nr:hypothetical protein [Acidimicrobiales bacterium]